MLDPYVSGKKKLMGTQPLSTVTTQLWARLVIVFKKCCLKRCENCGLKSVVEQRVFSVNKTKKCVWYHSLNNIFQCSKTVKYVFGMCVFNDKKS